MLPLEGATATREADMPTSLPNILTYARIAMVPVVVGCVVYEGDWARWLALVVFIVAGITDFFDGYLARAWAQQSNLGRMLDPIADKLLVAAVLLALTREGTIAGYSLWAALVILCREILVSGLREFLAELRVSVPVSQLAKWKTTIQMIALAFLLAGPAGDKLVSGVTEVGIALLWAAAILTLYTGYDYFKAGIDHLTGPVPDAAPPPAAAKRDGAS
jgi:cardiolipin synthase